MTTSPITEDRSTEDPRYCPRCGTPVTGPFCAGCGEATRPIAETPTAEFPPPHSGTRARPSSATPNETATYPPAVGKTNQVLIIGPWVAAGVAVVVAIALTIVVVTSSASDTGSTTKYRQQVARVSGPILGANQQVSDELGRLHGMRATDARAAVRRAQGEVTRAQGAMDALTAPNASESLSRAVHQVLDRETAYLTAVGDVLARPSRSGANQLQTLAANLTSALSAAGPAVAGTSQSVTNTDTLVRWAARAAHARRVRHQGVTPTNPSPGGGGGGGGGGGPVDPLAGGRSCGGGLSAGPNTTCAFAQNVRDAYNQAPGATATVQAFSPATGQTYTMDCAPSGSGVTCSGGNNASVSF